MGTTFDLSDVEIGCSRFARVPDWSQMEEKMRFTELVNAEVILVENGHARLELTVDRLHWSSADRLHGGVLFTLLDTALGRAVVSTLDEGRGSTTIEAKINFFRPVFEGRLTADAQVVNRGRRTAYAEGEIRDAEGRLVARATSTFMLTETFKQGEKPDSRRA